MQSLEVSGVVRLIYRSLGGKGLSMSLHIITVAWTSDSQYLQANGCWWMTLSIESMESIEWEES